MKGKSTFKNIKFPKPKEINWSKYIEPKKVVFVTTKEGITTQHLKRI